MTFYKQVNHINYKNASMLLMVQRLLERQGDLTFIDPKCGILGVEVTDLNCLPYCKCTLEEDPWHKYAELLPLKKKSQTEHQGAKRNMVHCPQLHYYFHHPTTKKFRSIQLQFTKKAHTIISVKLPPNLALTSWCLKYTRVEER